MVDSLRKGADVNYDLDLFASRAARDAALESVERPSLTDQLEAFLLRQRGRLMTGEDIRVESGLEVGHHNAWGASIMQLKKRGILGETGEFRQMRLVKSHARMTPVYQVL